MIYKVLYQKDQIVNPRRETTKTLFLEADNVVAAKTDLVEEAILGGLTVNDNITRIVMV